MLPIRCIPLLAVVANFAAAEVAHAFQRNISFCNRTEEGVDVAIGYERSGT